MKSLTINRVLSVTNFITKFCLKLSRYTSKLTIVVLESQMNVEYFQSAKFPINVLRVVNKTVEQREAAGTLFCVFGRIRVLKFYTNLRIRHEIIKQFSYDKILSDKTSGHDIACFPLSCYIWVCGTRALFNYMVLSNCVILSPEHALNAR